MRLNYGELEERVNRLTHGLRALGVGPGERIGAFLYNGHEYLELTAALNGVGGASVNIGYRLKAGEVAYILENSGARAMIFHSDLAPVVEEALTLVKNGNITRERCIAAGGAPGFRSYEDLLAGGDPTAPARVDGGGYGGVMIYTSGTTGRAKGATRDFRRMSMEPAMDFMSRFPLRRDERHLVVCPLYHSMARGVRQHDLHGRRLQRHRAPLRSRAGPAHHRARAHHLDHRGADDAVAPDRARPPEALRKYDTSSLRWLMSGAAPLPTELARRVEDAFGPILYNFYGATETGLVTIALPGEHTARPGTIGRLINGNEVRLLDGEGREVPVGEVGELYVRNGMLMDGYHANAKGDRGRHARGLHLRRRSRPTATPTAISTWPTVRRTW